MQDTFSRAHTRPLGLSHDDRVLGYRVYNACGQTFCGKHSTDQLLQGTRILTERINPV